MGSVGLVLHRQGRRVLYLGQHTPVSGLRGTLAIGGAGATDAAARRMHATLLSAEMVDALGRSSAHVLRSASPLASFAPWAFSPPQASLRAPFASSALR